MTGESRRVFLGAAVSSALLLQLGAVACRRGPRSSRRGASCAAWQRALPEERILSTLDALYGDIEPIRLVGDAWIEAVGDDLDALTAPLKQAIESAACLDEAVDAALGLVQEDFEGRNTQNLHGWTLAEAELALCALAVRPGGHATAEP